MYSLISKLVLYSNISQKGSILREVSELEAKYRLREAAPLTLREEASKIIYRLVDTAETLGSSGNLWHIYLAYSILKDENVFSLAAERRQAVSGGLGELALRECEVLKSLFNYDLSSLAKMYGEDDFRAILSYKSTRGETSFGDQVNKLIRSEAVTGKDSLLDALVGIYKKYGVGKFGFNKAFKINKSESEGPDIEPVSGFGAADFSDLIGYENQKTKLIANTKTFAEGGKGQNVLLYGDSGTGKSTSVRAIGNTFYDSGVRLVDVRKDQIGDITDLISILRKRNYRFIIYMDDLSFEENETQYKALKAAIEGGLEAWPDNVLIYATSNRRHLVNESWHDRSDMETKNGIHRSDTVEEKLSLVKRFGLRIYYGKPGHDEFYRIVDALADKAGINISRDDLHAAANVWELRGGGLSGRSAKQFVNSLKGGI